MGFALDLLLFAGFYDDINWTFHTLFIVFFLVLGSVLFIVDRRRRAGFEKEAKEMNMIYMEQAPERIMESLSGFFLMSGGDNSRATQVLRRASGDQELLVFNWFFIAGSMLGAMRGGFACVVLELDGRRPALRLFPRDHRIGDIFSSEDEIMLEEDVYLDHHRLFCRDRKFAQAFFRKEMIALLEGVPELFIEFDGSRLLLAREGEMEKERLQEDIERAKKVATLIPIPKESKRK